MDDIVIIASESDEEYIYATKHDFKIKLSKWWFFWENIEFVGHTMNYDGISRNKKLVKDVIWSSKPKSEKQIGS